jgi:hypothetical protein
MRVPQVSERIKEAPAQALRGLFAGIGQLLLITDRLRNKAPFGQQVPPARVPERAAATSPTADRDVVAEPSAGQSTRTPSAPRTPTVPRTPKIPAVPKTPKSPAATEIRDFDKTNNVRLITGDEAYDDEPPAAEAAPSVTGETVPAAAEPAPVPDAPEPEPAQVAAAEGPANLAPPLANYDELSIASLRARLRNLDVTQLQGLLEYEKAHAGRADVIVMFERRIAKLEAGD